MNQKINMLLRILGISILFLNLGSILGSAADSNVIIFVMSNAQVYVDGVYKGDSTGGSFHIALPALTTHTLTTVHGCCNDYTKTFKVAQGYMLVTAPMIPLSWGWSNSPKPTPAATPAPTPTPTPAPDSTPTLAPDSQAPASAPTSSDKYIEFNSEPSGANVYYGSTLIGTTPFTYKLPYAQEITFKLPGYNDKVTYIEQLTKSPYKIYLAKSFV